MLLLAVTVACPVTVKNTGNVRITAIAVQGNSNNCSQAVLLPDETADCFMWQQLNRADFAADTFNLAANGATGTPAGSVTALPTVAASTANVPNPDKYTALLSVSVGVNTSSVAKAGQAVLYTVTLVSDSEHVLLYRAVRNRNAAVSRHECYSSPLIIQRAGQLQASL